MTVNGHTKPVQRFPDALCASCGFPANPGSDHVVVEFNPSWSSRTLSAAYGTVVVTTSCSIKWRNHNEVLSRIAVRLTVRLLYSQN